MWYFWGNSTDVVEVKTAERARLLAQVSIETAMDASGRDAYLKATGLSLFRALQSMDSYVTVASDIVANIEQGKWTASEVLEAYIQASVRAQEVTNCLTESKSWHDSNVVEVLKWYNSHVRGCAGPCEGPRCCFCVHGQAAWPAAWRSVQFEGTSVSNLGWAGFLTLEQLS